MKMKEVCARTGLSDRAVRFYMEEEQAALQMLNRLEEEKPYSIAELARALSVPAEERQLPPEDLADRLGRRRKIQMLVSFGMAVAPLLLPWFWFNWDISHWIGLSMMRDLFSVGCILALCLLICGTERQAALLRLGGGLLALGDYVLAFVLFQERANISDAIDLVTSLRVSHWGYWLACIWLAVFIIRWMIDILKRE